MRLSVVFELLLVFLFLAFAAARVIDPKNATKNVTKGNKKAVTVRQGPPNRYCACTSRMCNCCRDFSLPVVPLKGPGCASIMYLQRDTMMVTMSFGDRVLSNTTISGKTPKPVCMTLPGGISQFCGRIYGISRKGDQFRACLGLELRALDDIEAALRVSCFKFGPKGVKLESAPPVPAESGGKDPEEEDDDDYDLDDDDDDDLIGFVDDDDDGASSEDNEVDSDSVDYAGFSVLGEDLLGTLFSDDSGSSSAKKKKVKKTAKPQTAAPKTTTTTRRPLLPNRRRSTIRPVSKRPVIKITKKPRPTVAVPQIVQRPSVQVSSVVTSHIPIRTTSLPSSSTVNLDKNIVTKESSTTPMPVTTMESVSVMESQQKEKEQTTTEKVREVTKVQTEAPVTFTIGTEKMEIIKNDIKIPHIDLAKVEAVAAIAQQDVTSGVISSSSLTSEMPNKHEEAVTLKYERVTPSYMPETTTEYISGATEKINSVKFVPTTILVSSPSAEPQDEDDLLDGIVSSNIAQNLNTAIDNSKPSTHYQLIAGETVSHKQQEGDSEGSDEDENEEEEEEDDDDEQNSNTVERNKIKQSSQKKKGNHTVSLKKQPVKAGSGKPESDNDEEEEDDLLDGVLSDDDDEDDNEEAEEDEESSDKPSQGSPNKNEVSEDEEEEDDEEDDILGSIVETQEKEKPSKVGIKKKPSPDKNESQDDEEEEEEDILDVLGDDDEEEESEDDEDDDDESDDETNKKKVTQTVQSTTVRIKKPEIQKVTYSYVTRKPVTTTEKVFSYKEPEQKEPEKIIIYQEPADKVTEKVIIYREPPEKVTEKIFIYKEPENKVTTQMATEKVIFYNQPSESAPNKFIIYNEPEADSNEKPAIVMSDKNDQKSSEESKEESKEDDNENERDEENSSEEESDDENDGGKHTVFASIIKPGFSNKYGEEHDLPDSDDLDIEDAEDDGSDFEEDRKLKQSNKKIVAKPSVSSLKPADSIPVPKTFGLSDLLNQRKKFYESSKDSKPISTSRTHRRMNLDRWSPL